MRVPRWGFLSRRFCFGGWLAGDYADMHVRERNAGWLGGGLVRSILSCRGLCCRLVVLLCGCVAACSVPPSRLDNALSPSGGGWAAVGSPSLWGVPRPRWRRDSMRLAIGRPLLARAAVGRAPLASHVIAIGRPPRGIRPWRGLIRPSIRQTAASASARPRHGRRWRWARAC